MDSGGSSCWIVEFVGTIMPVPFFWWSVVEVSSLSTKWQVSVHLVTPRHFSVLFFSIDPLTNVGRQGRLVLTRIPQLGIRTPESTKMADTKTPKFSRFSLTRQVYQKIWMRSSNFAFFSFGNSQLEPEPVQSSCLIVQKPISFFD